ncbi:hypothetical protein SAMN04488028_103208 [Reichenbachiella agariperforans]|uniref:Uncharacterized protein n=1 Tax=Reichenbachiella agariperforans TaxID=156994 RepID=A0A1M6Q892_REIAG|nr:hypothetical protein [Reichenbachiella agariperforans]SHK16327.1 hypothetical protein SAMN04488028_103208 [Reichenbachiella agariperforans]
MKPELTLNEVNDYIKHLKSFIYDISICISNIEQIIKSQNEGLLLKPIEGFIGHYVYLSYSNCVINCYKIFKKGESWSILKLCNKIENSDFNKELRELIESNEKTTDSGGSIKSKAEFIQIVSVIRAYIDEQSAILEKVNNRRLKFYAHSDKDASDFQPETLSDLKVVKDLAIAVFHKINEGLTGVHFMFEINIASIDSVLEDRKLVDEYWQKIGSKT